MFNLGSSYFHVPLITVRHLLNVMCAVNIRGHEANFMRPRSRQRPERVRLRPNDLTSRPHWPRGLNIPDEHDIVYMNITHFIFSLVSNSNLNSPPIVVQKWTQLEHSRPKSIDKLPLLSLAYMFNRGCRPNLLAIIAAQKAQSIQRSVTEARTIFVHSVPAVEKARSASSDVGGIDCK